MAKGGGVVFTVGGEPTDDTALFEAIPRRQSKRFAPQVTALGLKVAFVNQPAELARLRPELAALVGIPGRRPDLLMRFGHGPTLP